MRRLIFADAKPVIGKVIGQCPSHPDVGIFLNEAQERLLNRSTDPATSTVRYHVCIGTSNCVVLPRQVRHVKAWWLCDQPGLVLPEWYENLGYAQGGRGLASEGGCSGGPQLIDRGTVCSFDNIRATVAEPRRIQVVATDPSDNGKFITLRYIDSNSNRVYTSIDGTIQEGERLALSTSGTLTSAGAATGKVASNGLYHVVKAVTNYPVRVYSWDVNSASQAAQLAIYEPSETVPIYRQMYIPGYSDMVTSDDEDCTTNRASITLAVRLQHIPVINDNDPLVIGNLPALKDMVQSILMKQRHEYDAADALEASAARELDGELSAYLGDGALPVIRTPDSDVWGAGVYCVV